VLSSQVINSYLYAESCEDVNQQQLLADDNGSFGHNGGNNYQGIQFATASALGVGAKLVSFTAWLKLGVWDSGITALATSRLYDSSGVLKEESYDSVNPNTELNASTYTEKTLNFSGNVVIAENDKVVFYIDSGTSGHYIHAQFYNSDVYDGVNTVNWRNSAGYSGEDFTFKLTYCE
tara:strand:- start:13 stop:543 length:531 start_codon:yes stop_codon:yes gene_type:complete